MIVGLLARPVLNDTSLPNVLSNLECLLSGGRARLEQELSWDKLCQALSALVTPLLDRSNGPGRLPATRAPGLPDEPESAHGVPLGARWGHDPQSDEKNANEGNSIKGQQS